MHVCIHDTIEAMGAHAARTGASAIREAIASRGSANIILATGTSQFAMLERLVNEPGIDWSCVTAFHLDEYVGIPSTHPASFRRYLKERVVDQLPALGEFHFIQADAPALSAEIERLNALIRGRRIDVAFIGIGENGHLAFNDPPADMETGEPYLVVDLDERCRLQQVGEGWFATLDEVPRQAVSMSIPQILKAERIVCTVPDVRKAEAVEMALNAPVGPQAPCAALRTHRDCWLMLDYPAARKVLRGRPGV